MYCVIQKIENKKCNICGEAKKLEVNSYTWTLNDGKPNTHYVYEYTGKFERPIKTAYKISIHKSFRENGKVKKKQWVICTMGYYDLIEFCLYDFADSKITKFAEETRLSTDCVYDMVYEKLQPIIDIATKEYEATEEYKTKVEHRAILQKYFEDKTKFEDKFGKDTYDYCYDIFGVLRNEEYLKGLQESYAAEQKYKSSYQSKSNNNYSNYDFGGYSSLKASTYTLEEKDNLKKIYRTLASKFHPDISKDNGEIMRLVNKLKEEWKL